jgi:hypothetical protein
MWSRNLADRAAFILMPLFFFDFVDGVQTSEDDVGTELIDLEEARVEAVATLTEIARHELPGADRRVFAVHVRGEDGSLLLTVSLTLRVERDTAPESA